MVLQLPRMRLLLPYLMLLFTVVGCQSPSTTTIASSGPATFTIDLGTAGTPFPLSEEMYEGRNCTLTADTIGGYNALRLTTASEFSDGFIDVERLFGHPVDLSGGGYLQLRLYVPASSWIAALKLNLEDGAGNLGGIPEVANNFPGHYDRWFDVVVKLGDYHDRFRLWDGEEGADVLANVARLSLNPYCAQQEESSSIYINRIAVTREAPTGETIEALMPMPPKVANVPYVFTFDDDDELRRQIAYRTFEGSNQAFARGIGGNDTRAIRIRGREELDNIAFLPIISQVTGQPADFTGVERIYFDYYLEEGHDQFDGSTLYLTSAHWDDILIDTTFYGDFTAGSWQSVSVALADTDLSTARGDGDRVLPAVHELRLNLNFREGQKDITMWIDNFGWE